MRGRAAHEPARDLPGLVDRRELLHLDRPPGRPARLEPAGRRARRARERRGSTPEARAEAREEILIAEGSDWFWWYGDDHSSAHDLEFDDLFRRHLRNAYRRLGRAVPDELYVSNISTVHAPRRLQTEPTALLAPTLDGEETSYFEWLGAGSVEVATTGARPARCTGRPNTRRW